MRLKLVAGACALEVVLALTETSKSWFMAEALSTIVRIPD